MSTLYEAARSVGTYEKVWKFTPHRVVDCTSVEQVCSTVVEAAEAGLRVRAMGLGNSWATQIITDGVCLRTPGLNRIITIDTDRKTVKVGAGVRLGDLTQALAQHGLALPSLSFISDITVGGAVATATHGTSPKWGTISDFVRSMSVVLASGEVRKLSTETSPDELCAARVAIGMLGVIVEAELQAVDIPWVRFSEFHMNMATFLDRHQAICEQYEHVWVHWIPGPDVVRVECLESQQNPSAGFHQYVLDDNALWQRPRSPIPVSGVREKSSLRRAMRRFRSAWKPRTNGYTPIQQNGAGRKLQMSMQYGVSVSQLEIVMRRILDSGFAKLHPDKEIELKFLKGQNSSYLGPNSDGDAVLFNLWWNVDDDVKYTIFDPFEKLMHSLNGRPHWGKLHKVPDIEYMKAVYPQWNTFESIRTQFDPGGTFSVFN